MKKAALGPLVVARFACCPSKMDFIKKTMNWIDLLGKDISQLLTYSFIDIDPKNI
jgi:hypothetical protein